MEQDSTAKPVYDFRLERRKNTLIHAFVSDRSGHSNLKCVIRSTSKSGCQIASSFIEDLPPIVEIVPEGFDKPLIGKIVWRNSKIAGVEFLSPVEIAAYDQERPQPVHRAEPTGFFSRLQSFASLRRSTGQATRDESRSGSLGRDYGARVLHGLRNPLGALRGLLKLLLGGTIRPIPRRARTIIRAAQKNAQKAEALVEEALQVNNIESGQLPCNPGPLDIVELASDVLLTNTGHAAKYDVRFEMSEDVGKAMVEADTARMEDVLSNLLANAAKSSPVGDTVTLALTRNERRIRVSVSDRGVGATLEDGDAGDPHGDPEGGEEFKAGFDICRAILAKHDSALHVDSRPGWGTTVWFELPEIV